MFMLIAVIQPYRLERVRSELLAGGVNGLTVCECVGSGRQPRFVSSLHGGPDIAELVPKVRIDVVVTASQLEIAIDAVQRGARLGEIGDGKIFVSKIDKVVAVRTGWEDDHALSESEPWSEAAE